MINISYIAPITNYKFDPSSFYYLIISYCDNLNNMFIYKILIRNLNNINKITRAYLVNKSINLIKSSVMTIFELDKDSKLKLLFIGNINLDNKNNQIILDSPVTKKLVNYTDITSFLQETHYDYENISSNDKCIIILNKIKDNNNNIISPFKIIINNSYSYDPKLNIYIKKNNYMKNYKNPVRKLEINNYDADIMYAPIDGIYYLEDNTIIIYTRKQDYPVFYSPYEARLVKINNLQDKLILDFETNYFMPKSVHERSLLSVVNGNYTYGGMGVGIDSRNYPETLEPQPDTKLYYKIIIMNNINHDLKINTNYLAGDILINKLDPDTKIIISTNMLFKSKYDHNLNNLGVKLRSNAYLTSIDYKDYKKN